MPRTTRRSEILVEDILCKTKDRKSHKKSCDSSKDASKDACNVDCCVPDCNPECCTAAFQRLDKLRMVWLLSQYNLTVPVTFSAGGVGVTTIVFNRASQLITDVSPITGTPTTGVDWGVLALAAYTFVNEVRYLNFEECGKLDQVTGWSVDLQSGDLYLYQNLPDLGLSTADSRSDLLNTATTAMTPTDRRKLAEMEPFWKLSLKAVEKIRENPKTEGNICEVRDKCGNRFLIAINRTDNQEDNSVCEYNSKFSIVAVKLC